jgi:nucleotide-binding universal stress UspA family protein
MLKVVVPVDFSENSRKALILANNLVEKVGGVLYLVTVFLPVGGAYSILQGLTMKKSENIKLALNGQLSSLAEEVCSVPVQVAVMEGDTVEGVLYHAGKTEADLIIMGTKGKSDVSNVFMGSNAASVMQKSKIPVITVPFDSQVQHISKVIYASDFENFEGEYTYTSSLSQKAGWPIEVVHVLTNPGLEPSIRQKITDFPLAELTFIQPEEGESLTQSLKRFLNSQKDALLVMFTHKRGFMERLFQVSQTKDMSYGITLPLMSVGKLKANS